LIPSGNEKPPMLVAIMLLNWAYLEPLQKLELYFYRKSGLKMFVHFQGNDVRQGAMFLDSAKKELRESLGDMYYTPLSDRIKRRQVNLFDRYCQKLYFVNPDLAKVLPSRAEFVPYAITVPEMKATAKRKTSTAITVLHAPSSDEVKGTRYVTDAAETLEKNDGRLFRFKIIRQVENLKVLKSIRYADLVIDQLLFGWYGSFAAESMARGKPVVCFINPLDKKILPKQMQADLPILNASIDNLVEVLERFHDLSVQEKNELAEKSHKFVRSYHDKNIVARKIKADYVESLQS
jgi:glycosyltransferase involved in cell wall biosynthesis